MSMGTGYEERQAVTKEKPIRITAKDHLVASAVMTLLAAHGDHRGPLHQTLAMMRAVPTSNPAPCL